MGIVAGIVFIGGVVAVVGLPILLDAAVIGELLKTGTGFDQPHPVRALTTVALLISTCFLGAWPSSSQLGMSGIFFPWI